MLWSGNLIHDQTEHITSVICLPLESVGRSSQHAVDWTCVVVGFTSGQVRFYTENGSLMVSELFHEEPVVSLKCHSYRPSSFPGEVEYCEEFIITYLSAVVHLDGFALFQTLRGCRSHLARGLPLVLAKGMQVPTPSGHGSATLRGPLENFV
ncbi:hypothetical protein J437_LFUL018219 [Ladona fulva]|uniref:Rab3-GAP regulatory subunit N-terminal domain-containing protein n=1 Tax=Ladona fulva TaxID=123851 RepID=A0A8K0KR34_LADFU|nr:hypothetical protein J437_LFUL018219 [Ladona fulva]